MRGHKVPPDISARMKYYIYLSIVKLRQGAVSELTVEFSVAVGLDPSTSNASKLVQGFRERLAKGDLAESDAPCWGFNQIGRVQRHGI